LLPNIIILNNMNKSAAFVIGQFIFGIFLLVTTSFLKISFLSGLFMFLGFITVFWAVITMRRSVIKVFPDVDKRAKLIEGGPYRWIRHPMYSGVLLACFGLLLTQFTLIRFIVYIFLVSTLILKLSYEERLLKRHFKNYDLYKKKTFHLIPFIY